MNKRIVKALYRKEILDILRDKKTILMMIVVPLILYPLIFMFSMYLSSTMLTASTSKSYRVSVQDTENAEELKEFILDQQEEHDYQFIFVDSYTANRDSEEALREKEVDAYVMQSVSENRPYYEIGYMASETDSQTAAGMLRDMLSDYKNDLRDKILEEQGLDSDEVLSPIKFELKDFSTKEENAGYIFGYIVPFLLITSILMGAMYPAIDTTAGEKERGTLETLLTLPVKNLELITAKFLATSTVAVAAALLNLLSMAVMVLYILGSTEAVGQSMEVNLVSYIPALIITLLCVLVFAMFASGVCLCACIYARSFKEAQNYTTPVMLIFMMGGMAGMIPSLRLDGTTALIPVINITLLIAELFKFHFDLSLIAMVLVSNLAYAGIAVVLMARLFSSENILFGDAAASLKLMEARKDMKDKQIPGMGDVVLLFSILLIVMLFGGSLAVSKWGLYGLFVEQGSMLVCVLAYCWYIKADFPKVFHFRKPRMKAVIASVLIIFGSYLVIQVIGSVITGLFSGLSTENTEMLVSLWENKPLWLLIMAVAIVPPICEEFVFRGFLLGALEHKYEASVAVVACGLLFGLYHMSILQFILIGLVGIVLTYVAWKEQCIFLSILMHALNNLTSLLIQQYEEEVTKALPFLADDLSAGTAFGMVAVGVVLMVLGYFVLNGGKAKKTAAEV